MGRYQVSDTWYSRRGYSPLALGGTVGESSSPLTSPCKKKSTTRSSSASGSHGPFVDASAAYHRTQTQSTPGDFWAVAA